MTATMRILYAEDYPLDAEMTRTYFAEHAPEFDLEIVDSGQSCLDRLDKSEFDLVLLDNHLPDMDGIDVLRTLVRSGSQVPVVLVTGVGDEELVVKALRLGAANYVPKVGNYLESIPDIFRSVAEEHRQRRSLGLSSTATPRKILYIEHLTADIELTQQHFAEHAPHFEIEVVESCAEAMTRLSEPHEFDLALIDLRMPDQGGLDFVREVKRRHLALPPFIMISGKGDDALAIATLRLGAADYIAKRHGYLEQLVYCIENAIAHHRIDQVNRQLQAELAERREAETRLREMQERLAQAVDAGQVGLWDWDLATNEVYYSPEWKRQIGYADDEISDDFVEWKRRVHPEDIGPTMQTLDAYLSGDLASYEVEFRFRHKDGSFRHILARGSKLVDHDGKPIRLLGSHVDITERTELQAQYVQAQRLAVVGQLAGGIAHDFNNVLTVIIGTAEIGLRRVGAENPVAANFNEIRQAGLRAAKLTRQLLAFSRQQIMKPEVLNLSELVTNLQQMLRRLLGEDINLVVSAADQLGSIRADPGQIEQVIMNLVVNARDAMPTGGTLTIETAEVAIDEVFESIHSSIERGPYVMLMVRDTGIGMNEATRARIFEPFFTTKEQGKGTGLGLATVYGVVKQSGGDIWLESKLGAGTTFKIFLPRVDDVAAPAHPTHSSALATGTETILVVEDDEQVRALAERILNTAGYNVLTAGNGDDAILLLDDQDQPVDLLLTDVVMPGMSGLDLASRVGKARPAMKIVFTSGHTDDAILQHGVRQGTCHFINKPYSTDELTLKVREVLDSRTDLQSHRHP